MFHVRSEGFDVAIEDRPTCGDVCLACDGCLLVAQSHAAFADGLKLVVADVCRSGAVAEISPDICRRSWTTIVASTGEEVNVSVYEGLREELDDLEASFVFRKRTTDAGVSIGDGHACDRGQNAITPDRWTDMLADLRTATDIVDLAGEIADGDGLNVALRETTDGIVLGAGECANKEWEGLTMRTIVERVHGLFPTKEAVPAHLHPVSIVISGVNVCVIFDSLDGSANELDDVLNESIDDYFGEDLEAEIDLLAFGRSTRPFDEL